MLLRFRVTNHRSLRDTAELVLTTSRFRGAHPADGAWSRVSNRVAGIFGANASGKTALLHAMEFAVTAVRDSARWTGRDGFPSAPFLLDATSRDETSAYEFDLTVAGTRHVYGFESGAAGVAAEWLHAFPRGRRQVLFERTGPDAADVTFGRSTEAEDVPPFGRAGGRGLVLSAPGVAHHPRLRGVHRFLTRRLTFLPTPVADARRRVAALEKWCEDARTLRQAESLLRFADLGISRLPHARSATGPPLNLADASSGTLTWLSLALPALRAIEHGGVLLVDGLGSGLHPTLTSALIGFFTCPVTNTSGAQLLFTSHDVSLLGHPPGGGLGVEGTWFTEKSPDGATELYPLSDFPAGDGHDLRTRYLGGRYGAVPVLARHELPPTHNHLP
ncbi:AAA family ATPase [Streptomyces avicenniae]|uniref:AAA family ATPase n=1 Tax=Streptomyces avicenniae TaxID=500153 RepID=UPI000699F6BC|nr:ATP-binding protein [Streptomyces avicenniae]